VNRVALTFDDGPHPVQSRVIMELLEQHGCPSSFFLTGSKIAAHENIIREMAARGHTLGNHSFSHSSRFPLMAPKRIAAEIKETNRLLEQAGGHPVRFFRPPFGVTNPRIHRGLQGQELVVVGWSIRSYDTCKGSPEKVVARIMERVRGGDIILLHETSDHIAEILELLLPQLRNKGLECVSLETLLGDR
jgi:peptidoglycan/xylan/chitin deacetylase (PgdA/CDA1 family)